MSRESIGEFEQLVLLAILRLRPNAYGVPILHEITSRTGRAVLRPAVYVALRRMQAKGWVSAREAEGDARRGGRARRFYDVTPEGMDRLRDARRALEQMWDGLGPVLDEPA